MNRVIDIAAKIVFLIVAAPLTIVAVVAFWPMILTAAAGSRIDKDGSGDLGTIGAVIGAIPTTAWIAGGIVPLVEKMCLLSAS